MHPIVVGFDGSPAAERALERAAALRGDEGRVVVVTATVSNCATRVLVGSTAEQIVRQARCDVLVVR